MIYEATTGLNRQPSTKLINGLVLGLPVLIAVLLIAAALTSRSYTVSGKQPIIGTKPDSLSPSASTHSQPSNTAPTNTASDTAFKASPSGSSATPDSISPQSSSGATTFGGGAGGGGTTSSSPSTSSILPATITTPPTDIQVDGKRILSTSPTTVTIN